MQHSPPPQKFQPPLSLQPSSKNEGCVKPPPPPFWKFGRRFNPSLQNGGWGCTLLWFYSLTVLALQTEDQAPKQQHCVGRKNSLGSYHCPNYFSRIGPNPSSACKLDGKENLFYFYVELIILRIKIPIKVATM